MKQRYSFHKEHSLTELLLIQLSLYYATCCERFKLSCHYDSGLLYSSLLSAGGGGGSTEGIGFQSGEVGGAVVVYRSDATQRIYLPSGESWYERRGSAYFPVRVCVRGSTHFPVRSTESRSVVGVTASTAYASAAGRLWCSAPRISCPNSLLSTRSGRNSLRWSSLR